MEHKFNDGPALLWMGATGLIAVALAVNAVRAAAGSSVFAWWHIGSLCVSALMAESTMSDALRARCLSILKSTKWRLRKSIHVQLRAARSLVAALFTYPSNRPQTEP